MTNFDAIMKSFRRVTHVWTRLSIHHSASLRHSANMRPINRAEAREIDHKVSISNHQTQTVFKIPGLMQMEVCTP